VKLVKAARKIGVLVAAAAAAVTMWSGSSARAATDTWGSIEPVSADFSTLWTGPECLALNGSDGYYNDHTRVIQWQCTGNDDQQWETRLVGTSSFYGRYVYQVVNKKSGKCLEPRYNLHSNGTLIDQITCVNITGVNGIYNAPAQAWTISYSGYGQQHQLAPFFDTAACLDVDSGLPYNGTKVQLWDCHGGDNQHFVGAPLDFLSS
jgi:hypothetical protein